MLNKGDEIVIDLGNHYVGYFSFMLNYVDMYIDAPVKLCTQNELLTKHQDNNELTELQVMQDELKTMPFGDIWDEYCRQCGVKCDREWFDEVKVYEKEVLSRR